MQRQSSFKIRSIALPATALHVEQRDTFTGIFSTMEGPSPDPLAIASDCEVRLIAGGECVSLHSAELAALVTQLAAERSRASD